MRGSCVVDSGDGEADCAAVAISSWAASASTGMGLELKDTSGKGSGVGTKTCASARTLATTRAAISSDSLAVDSEGGRRHAHHGLIHRAVQFVGAAGGRG